ncbi:MAG: AsmA-like C-terminal region-containing protein, partial [Gammaproteobacteria bacterium]|nr:AsmA-like C-terminal region-containing protein [Gammaproteobacteria bacterium]
LGLDPVVAGEAAEVTANVYWDSGPSSEWLDHLSGDVSLYVETGSLREIDPGAGRVVGLMSIAALPRRLTLDFRDVFDEGFAFDEIRGDFLIVDGNAYTDNLLFAGPGAEIGVVGRTGLRDRDYQQQVVVTAEPGNVLPTVGGLLAGPGVGAALLLFTRLFKEPLKGIGRASYCLSGSWEEPEVERIDNDEEARVETCAVLPEAMLTSSTN